MQTATNPLTSTRTGPLTWEPMEKFSHPALKRTPNIGEEQEKAWAWLVAKRCAGLDREWKAGPAEVREALRTGRWSERSDATFRWIAQGESLWMLPWWYEACGISIYEITQGRMHLYPEQDTWAWWLNVWARNPREPKPWIGMWGWEAEYAGAQCLVEGRKPW